jgi:hypothetical protein
MSPRELTPEERAEIEAIARGGNKIEAIKVCRERTGLGLKEAKDLVESIVPPAPSAKAQGCGRVLWVLLGISLVGFAVMQLYVRSKLADRVEVMNTGDVPIVIRQGETVLTAEPGKSWWLNAKEGDEIVLGTESPQRSVAVRVGKSTRALKVLLRGESLVVEQDSRDD